MLAVDSVLSRDGVDISDVLCSHASGRGDATEHAGQHAIVFVRRGCFTRTADGVQAVLDPTLAYCMNPGEEQRYDHPHAYGDDCTALTLDERLVASLRGGHPTLPSGPLPSSPELDLEHRRLLAGARAEAEPHQLVERAIALAAATLALSDPRPVASGRPASTAARAALVDGARQQLEGDPDISLRALAEELLVSPHHLSRTFRAATGHTIARHRMRLRTRRALERLIEGERDLGWLAADLGFADQSHLCRVIRKEMGTTPSSLRAELTSEDRTP